MNLHRPLAAALLLVAALPGLAAAGTPARALPPDHHQVTYPPAPTPGGLQLGVTYTLWIPPGVRTLRGVIVHQHGCGEGACRGGETAAFDLHWQALARKWRCALLGPSYHQKDTDNCRLWCDPRNGSEQTFLRALGELGERSGHPELARVPWCLWGHSGGAFWASIMQTRHPERIVATWLRSGTAFAAWERGEIPRPEIPVAVLEIPTMCNPGARERGDARFDGAWTGSLAMFRAYRARGAVIGFAPDPRTSHECGDSRYLAIPYFSACLEQRLPRRPGEPLRPVDQRRAWLAGVLGESAVPAANYTGPVPESVWLPDERTALAWQEYVRTGAVGDATPPPPPFHVRALRTAGGVELRWEAHADLESGLRGFVIRRDGEELARLPAVPTGRFGRPLFQPMSYHDTPEPPLPEMRYLDTTAPPGIHSRYEVAAENSAGLRSVFARAR